MTTRRHHTTGAAGRALDIISLSFLFFSVSALPSCSPRIIENTRTEYVYRDRIQVDTTWLRDSVYVKEVVKGDTVRIVEHRDHLVYQYKMLRDTVSVVDSVTVERVKEVQVERPLTWAEKAKMRLFPWLLFASLALGVWTFRKPILKLIDKLPW